MSDVDISKIVQGVISALGQGSAPAASCATPANGLTAADYPIQEKRPELVNSATGKALKDLTFDEFLKGNISAQDLRVAPATLELQAQIAESTGRAALARNMRRAAELIPIPDARVLEIYTALRPNRSSREELLAIADELDQQYCATTTAALVREAAEVYAERDVLRRD